MRFLVVEDNHKLAQIIQIGLSEQGYVVDTTQSGHDAENMAASENYDAIVLDLMLPDSDGIQVCRNLRRRRVSTPILMLTALSATRDKVEGFEAGADDYLTKPFDMEELLARVRALLRRTRSTEAGSLRYGELELDLTRRTAKRSERTMPLTAKEFGLLELLMRNPDRVLTRSVIGERVWDMVFEEESNVIEVYISRLRSKIDRGFDRPLIHTVIGAGYILSVDGPPS